MGVWVKKCMKLTRAVATQCQRLLNSATATLLSWRTWKISYYTWRHTSRAIVRQPWMCIIKQAPSTNGESGRQCGWDLRPRGGLPVHDDSSWPGWHLISDYLCEKSQFCRDTHNNIKDININYDTNSIGKPLHVTCCMNIATETASCETRRCNTDKNVRNRWVSREIGTNKANTSSFRKQQ